jgi:ribosome-binding factor A
LVKQGLVMVQGDRASRVGDMILREIADLLMRKVKDPRVKGVTITGVFVSKDLRHAKVYFSVIGGERDIRMAQMGLDSAKGFIKREFGFRMDLKYVPDILFKHDPSLEKGSQMEKLLQKIKEDECSVPDE